MNCFSTQFDEAIIKIAKTIADYREGLARIEREFDAACERIDKCQKTLEEVRRHSTVLEKAKG